MAAQPMQRSSNIPPIVSDTISILEEKALQEQGILRVSGSALQIQELMKQYEKGKAVDLSKTPIHTVAGLLKRYFKDSPESLLTFELYEDFLAASAIQDVTQRVEEIKNLVESLPLANQEILHKLIVFLTHVSQYSEINSMTKGNLSTMFGPQLLRTPNQDGAAMMQDMPKIFLVIHTLIENHEAIFPGWPDDQEIKPGSEQSNESSKKGTSENLALVKRKRKIVEKAVTKWYGKNWKEELNRAQRATGTGIAVPVDRPRSESQAPPPEAGLLVVTDGQNLPPLNIGEDSSTSAEEPQNQPISPVIETSDSPSVPQIESPPVVVEENIVQNDGENHSSSSNSSSSSTTSSFTSSTSASSTSQPLDP